MIKRLLNSSILFRLLVVPFFTLLFVNTTSQVFAATANHIVISEIQLGGSAAGTTNDEFIELYNPTNSNIDVTGWRLARKTASAGAPESNLVADFPAKTINAHGYLLIAHEAYSGTPTEDITYNVAALSTNNTILLYDASDVIVDKVGLGSASDSEIAAKANPASGDSVERKATTTSTSATLAIGGTEETAGNGEETDNNSNDFVNRTEPQPQNISSSLEPGGSVTPTPTISVTMTPTATPSASPSATTTLTPTLTPTVSVSPTSGVTQTPTPSATLTPTYALTNTPTPQSGGIVFGTFIFPSKTIVCKMDVKIKISKFMITYIPVFSCSEV